MASSFAVEPPQPQPLPQQPELVGHGAHRERRDFGQVAHAELHARQCEQDPNPGRVAQDLEGLGQLLDRRGGQRLPRDGQRFRVKNRLAADVHVASNDCTYAQMLCGSRRGVNREGGHL